MKKQIIAIHGGDTFKTYEEYISFLKEYKVDLTYFKKKRWMDSLQGELGEEFEVITPQMPNKRNAKYVEWKIWFDKIMPLLNNEVILIGASLGGIFLAKYLSENKFPHNIIATFLIAAPFGGNGSEYSLDDFTLTKDLTGLERQGGKVFLYQSKDDPIVSFDDFEKYKKALPAAQFRIFEDKGHFNQEEFPELVDDIKKLFNLPFH